MKNSIKIILVVLVLGAVVAACSNSGGTQSGGDSAGGGVSADQQGEPFAPFSGLDTIELLTPTSGVGQKPNFEWSAVDGAASYTLFLNFSDGQPYWTWSGEATSIYLGGYDSPPPADAAGPILLDGMSWAVIAFNTEANVIASSNLQPISP
jgi:hypothetical protein